MSGFSRLILFVIVFSIIAVPGSNSQQPRPPIIQTYAGGSDFVDDIAGDKGYADHVIQFHPPAGYRVRIVSAYGSITSFPDGAVPPYSHAGVSWGLITSEISNSGRATNMNDHCMTYVKQSLSATADTASSQFSFDVTNGVLPADNTLISRDAAYTNTMGVPVHIEIALVVKYQFEPIE